MWALFFPMVQLPTIVTKKNLFRITNKKLIKVWWMVSNTSTTAIFGWIPSSWNKQPFPNSAA
jgi:hypothetical protein